MSGMPFPLTWSVIERSLIELEREALTRRTGVPVEVEYYKTDDGTPMVSLGPPGADAWYTFWKTETAVYRQHPQAPVQIRAALRDHLTAGVTVRLWDQSAAVETTSFVVPKVTS